MSFTRATRRTSARSLSTIREMSLRAPSRMAASCESPRHGRGQTAPGFRAVRNAEEGNHFAYGGSAGNLYAAAIGDKSRASGTTFTDTLRTNPATQGAARRPAGNPNNHDWRPAAADAPLRQHLRALRSGDWQRGVSARARRLTATDFGASRDTLVYSLGFSAAGKLLLGTGNRGIVIQLDGDNLFTNSRENRIGSGDRTCAGRGRKSFYVHRQSGKSFFARTRRRGRRHI